MATQSAGKKKEDGGGGGGRGGENIVVLDKVFRQKDSTFQRLLNDLRRGVLTETNRAILESKCGPSKILLPAGVEPTKLFAINKEADNINNMRLDQLPSKVYTFEAKDFGEEQHHRDLLRGLKAPEILHLKIGAQVMLLKNLSVEEGLVNGARGVVVGFQTNEEGEDEGEITRRGIGIKRIQYPLVEFIIRIGNSFSRRKLVVTPERWELKVSFQDHKYYCTLVNYCRIVW